MHPINALIYKPTPIQEISHPSIEKAGIRLLVKREDLNHRTISGNKWWKLKYNIAEAIATGSSTVLTFGGAYSNHIYATAAVAAEKRLKSIGVIRGEEHLPLNRTLKFASAHGMLIHYVTRAAYRQKDTAAFIDALHQELGDFYLIPEGGTNLLAVKGCAEFAETELSGVGFDHLLLPVGTGGTMAGLISGFKDKKNVIGVSVLRDGGSLSQAVGRMVREFTGKNFNRWSILHSYHHGGYAKVTPGLLSFVEEMRSVWKLPLEPVYTAKLFWAVLKEAEAGVFRRGDTLLVLHTGGLQLGE